MARTVLLLLGALVLAVLAMRADATATLTPGSTSYSAQKLARGVVKNMLSTGGLPRYVTDSASLVGGDETNGASRKFLQFGTYTTDAGTPLAVDGAGTGLILASGRVTNLFTGARQPLGATATLVDNPAFIDRWLNVTTQANQLARAAIGGGTRMANSVSLFFNVSLPAGNLTVNYAFCTDRELAAVGSVYDIVLMTVRNTSVAASPFVNFNFAYITGVPNDGNPLSGPSNGTVLPYTICTRRFSAASQKGVVVNGTSIGLPTNVTFCQTQIVATYVVPTTGTYTMQVTASRQNEAANLIGTSSFLLAAGCT
jgi:hypothetical protein